MTEIVIKSTKGNAVTTSLLVAEKFGKPHADVLKSIRAIVEQLPENECKGNFALTSNNVTMPNGGTRFEPFYVMTRDGFTLLVMGFTGSAALKFKLEFIAAFNEMERQLSAPQLPTTYLDALKALVESVEKTQIAENKVLELAPKAEFFDKVIDADNLLSWNEAAKALSIGRNRMLAILRRDGVINHKNAPYQSFISICYFAVKISFVEKLNANIPTTYVTGKGLTWLAKKLKTESK